MIEYLHTLNITQYFNPNTHIQKQKHSYGTWKSTKKTHAHKRTAHILSPLFFSFLHTQTFVFISKLTHSRTHASSQQLFYLETHPNTKERTPAREGRGVRRTRCRGRGAAAAHCACGGSPQRWAPGSTAEEGGDGRVVFSFLFLFYFSFPFSFSCCWAKPI